MKTVKQILIEARELISDPARWTQGEMARDKNGDACIISHGIAFCSIGAINHVGILQPLKKDAAYEVLRSVVRTYVSEWNDTHAHEEVLAAFDRAIEQCE